MAHHGGHAGFLRADRVLPPLSRAVHRRRASPSNTPWRPRPVSPWTASVRSWLSIRPFSTGPGISSTTTSVSTVCPVIFCIDRAGITGDDGPSHNGVMDLALLTKVPGMTVLAPSSYEEIPVMLAQAIAITSGPVALRWPKTEARHCAATGTGLSARQVRAGANGLLLGAGQNGRGLRAGGGGARRVAGSRPRCGTFGPPLPWIRSCCATRSAIRWSSPSRTVWWRAVWARRSPPPCAATAEPGPLPAIVSCGLPLAYFPQGKADDILCGSRSRRTQPGPDGRSRCARPVGMSEPSFGLGWLLPAVDQRR